jgi:N-acetyl-gamma-glutamyl-phosphate reductase
MSKFKIFVDGQEGTTGLEINERLKKRDDIEILKIGADKRKDISERAKFINQADIVFLCLPDDAARESVALINNDNTRVIDASTAHRTADGWDYGIAELSAEHRLNIAGSKRVSNPGCFPTGFNLLVYPLIKAGIMPAGLLVTCNSVTGYSGGGRAVIERYEELDNKENLIAPNLYSLALSHKHLPEMKKHSGLENAPLFSPAVCGFLRGMTVCVPLFVQQLCSPAALQKKKFGLDDIRDYLTEYYAGQKFVRVMEKGFEDKEQPNYYYRGINPVVCNGTNNLDIFVVGNEEQVLLAARFDNLGKGASGAAVQNMNIMLGIDETRGLV